uniref:U3 small nucleolar ribonucleoprotein protein MPP10 n=1 Tax=Denticeps clupeoides TaxID=299321 RepID=A0AAY4CQK9_9TELE
MEIKCISCLFPSVQDALAEDFTTLTKTLYDLHKAGEPVGSGGSVLEQLVVENFDEEQIWQELELQNSAVLRLYENAVGQAVKDKSLSILEEEEDGAGEGDEVEDDISDDDDQLDNVNEEEDEEDGEIVPDTAEGVVEEKYSDEDSDVDFDVDALENKTLKQRRSVDHSAKSRKTVRSEVDDKFFKLSEMEAFLDDMDRREGKEGADSVDIDYFQDLPSEDEDDLVFDKPSTSSKAKKVRTFKMYFIMLLDYYGLLVLYVLYEPFFFVSILSDREDVNKAESRQARDALKRVTFDLSEESEGEEMEDIFGGKNKNASHPEHKSSFEKRQQKMAEKIDELEKAALQEKPWQLTGEVTAQTRPENSMLEEDLEYDQASRSAPAITEETTLGLEDIIKQRIKDQVWDDVVRKEKPKENAFEYKKRLTLDHEKSKLSLAEVYEQEYIKQTQTKTEEEENQAHVEIQKLMDSLFLKLDALSNFHFTPKPPVPEVKVVSNLPSITMEEVAPVSVSNATLLAPEEVKEKNKGGDILGDTEKTATDKKRDRRKKKKLKRIRINEREKRQKLKASKKAGENQKPSKAEVAQTLKQLTKGGKAKILTNDGMDKALRSSQAFFSQLQDQVKSQVKGSKEQASKKKKKKNQKEVSANKLKL